MNRYFFLLFYFSTLGLIFAQSKGVALVIGNSDYQKAPLKNPVNDAKIIAQTLKKLGFELLEDKAHLNLDKENFLNKIISFGERLKNEKVGIFYYAGHAMQSGDSNYLLPVDVNISNMTQDLHITNNGINIKDAIKQMENANIDMKLMILDACRTSIKSNSRSIFVNTRGLRSIPATTGTIILYATQLGNVAEDGDEQNNSPFTSALIEKMQMPGLKIEDVIKQTTSKTIELTNGRQTPWMEGSILSDFYFTANREHLILAEITAKAEAEMKSKLDAQRAELDAQIAMLKMEKSKIEAEKVKMKEEKVDINQNDQSIDQRKNHLKIDWVLIKGGTFEMGSAKGDEDEKPVHRVKIKDFYISKTEVTVGQYRKCVDDGVCNKAGCGYSDSNWNDSSKENHPINCIDWNQARMFAKWVGGDLPSEAQWEYASRSRGKDIKYPWGNDDLTCQLATYSACGSETSPVCSKIEGNTTQGLCDMVGNVWEWVLDEYHTSYNNAPSDDTAWCSDKGCSSNSSPPRVTRGGRWYLDSSDLRLADRDNYTPNTRNDTLGFRVARSVHKATRPQSH